MSREIQGEISQNIAAAHQALLHYRASDTSIKDMKETPTVLLKGGNSFSLSLMLVVFSPLFP